MKRLSYPASYPGRIALQARRRLPLFVCLIGGALLYSITLSAASAQAQESAKAAPKTQSGKENLGQVGAKLSNPLANLWALSMSFNMPEFMDGDLNTGDPELGATLLFQPVMPIPLFGTGDDQWRLITRPIIPFLFSKPIPKDEVDRAIHALFFNTQSTGCLADRDESDDYLQQSSQAG